jgi:hypothetical protein
VADVPGGPSWTPPLPIFELKNEISIAKTLPLARYIPLKTRSRARPTANQMCARNCVYNMMYRPNNVILVSSL